MRGMFPDPLRPKLYLDYIFLFSLCFPLGLSFLFSPNESYYAQAASVGMLELFCVCLFFFLKEGDDSVTIEKKWKIVVLFWMVWAIFATVHSISQPYSFVRQMEWFIHILFGFIIFLFLRNQLDYLKYLNLIIVTGFFILTIFLITYWCSTQDPQNFDWVHPPFFVHVRQLTHLVVAVILLIQIQNKHVWFEIPLLSVCWGVLFWNGGRAGILSVCFGVFVIAILGKRWHLLFSHGIAALIGFQLALLFPVNSQPLVGFSSAIERTVNAKTVNSVFTGRLSIWEIGLKTLKNNWLFGLGPDGFKDLWYIHQRGISNPHGSWLQFFLEWGVPGGTAFLIIKFRMLLKIWQKRTLIFQNEHAIGCFGLLCAYLLYSLVSGIFYYGVSLMLVCYSFGVLFAHIYPKSISPS